VSGSKLVLPAGIPVLWIFIDRFSQFNIISSKANSGAATEEEGLADTASRVEVQTSSRFTYPSMATCEMLRVEMKSY